MGPPTLATRYFESVSNLMGLSGGRLATVLEGTWMNESSPAYVFVPDLLMEFMVKPADRLKSVAEAPPLVMAT